MGAPFGQVIGIPSMGNGFLGEITRVGGGDPYVVSRPANVNNAANINVGDAVVLMPDATGGTVKQFADWIANGGGYSLSCGTASNTTVTPVAATMIGLAVGMFVQGPGIPAGTYITAVNFAAGTITISKAATATAAGVTLYFSFFYGVAVREVKTQQPYSAYTPGNNPIMSYAPGDIVDCLLRGGVLVKNLSGLQPVAGGPVWLRAILNAGTYPNGVVGGFEPECDTVNNVLLPQLVAEAYYKLGVVDSNNLVEITILSRVQS